MAWFEVLGFERGVAFAEAARDPTISEWPKIRARLVGSNHVVPAAAWDRLLDLLLERNPSTRSAVEEWTRTQPSPEDRQLEDFVGADAYGFAPLFERESEFEQAVLNTFVEAGLARLPDSADGLPLKGRQDRISTGLRPDLILVEVAEGADEQQSLVVVELKLWARSVANVRQLESYLDRLDEIVPDGWEIGGALVAQGFSQPVLEEASAAGIVCWLAQPIEGSDGDWDLLEAAARHVLVRQGGMYDERMGFPGTLFQAFDMKGLATPTGQVLQALKEGLDADPRRRLEQTLYLLGVGVNKLRNAEGTGHGHPFPPSVSDLEAKLAVEAMAIISELLLETP